MSLKKNNRNALVAVIGSLFPIFTGLTSPAFAQDVEFSAPSDGSYITPGLGEPGAPGGLIVPGDAYTAEAPDYDSGLLSDSPWTAEGEGFGNFFFPGGYGFLPELINTGAGWSGRAPYSFNLTLQGGYNDNIYSASGEAGEPIKGSATTQATFGGNILLANTRNFLSLGFDVGGTYYWNKDNSPLAPVGRINLTYGYKLSPRTQFSARINGGYFNQPDLNRANSVTRPNAGDYFNLENHFDLSYRWTERFSTVTTLEVNTQIYTESESQQSNYVRLLLGEAFRLKLTPLTTGVLDVRVSTNQYNGADRNSNTFYLLTGADSRLSPRLNGTIRLGGTYRQFDVPGRPDKFSPYLESSLGYQYGRGSHLRWTNRYGFEDSGNAYQSDRTFRTGLWVDHVLSSRLAATAGTTYAYSDITGIGGNTVGGDRHVFTGTVGLRYIINRSFTVFGNYTYNYVKDVTSLGDYKTNQFWLGTTYTF